MIEIYINQESDCWWLYDCYNMWKSYCGCENFDQEVVLNGNRDYTNITKADWYNRAYNLLKECDSNDKAEFYSLFKGEYSKDILDNIVEIYNKCRCIEDVIVDVCRILYPNDTFSTGTIRGYCQREWQDYIVKGDVDIDMLQTMFFGQVSDITISDDGDNYGDIITDNELWELERKGNLKEKLIERYDLQGKDVKVFLSDGYVKKTKWKEV